jgi:dipeptidyl aminopeptidase/acylaminoacyl peptidase
MKSLLTWLICIINVCASGQNTNQNKLATLLNKDSINSTLDGNLQVFYYYKSNNKPPQPLIVQLHSWSYPADSLKTIGLDSIVKSKNYNYIFPNFRGVNNHSKACCSDFVIADIDEAIDWALKNMNVDKNRIYVIGYSGGGYTTLAMYMKSRHNISGFSAWASISDLVMWYGESIERKNKYANEIISCTGADNIFDTLKAQERSPLFWTTPVKKRKKCVLQIFAGIHDGFNGPVPISQSINFYNKLLSDFRETDTSKYVNNEDLKFMVNTQSFPSSNSSNKIGNRNIRYQKASKKVMLTIFEGGHEILSEQALEYILYPRNHQGF